MAKSILVVDDDESILAFADMALSSEGYEVLTARNGAEALDVVQKRKPNLILLDMRMPVMDGMEFLQKYCEQPEPHVPIIAASAHASYGMPLLCASEFIAKPFNLDNLLEQLSVWLK